MEKFFGIIRHVLTFLAGLLVAKGIIDETMVTELVAALMGITGVIWSIVDKSKREGSG